MNRDAGESTQFAIGPSNQLYLKPLIKLKHVMSFDLDDSKARTLVLDHRSVWWLFVSRGQTRPIQLLL
jgi:hypothetical protein